MVVKFIETGSGMMVARGFEEVENGELFNEYSFSFVDERSSVTGWW